MLGPTEEELRRAKVPITAPDVDFDALTAARNCELGALNRQGRDRHELERAALKYFRKAVGLS